MFCSFFFSCIKDTHKSTLSDTATRASRNDAKIELGMKAEKTKFVNTLSNIDVILCQIDNTNSMYRIFIKKIVS